MSSPKSASLATSLIARKGEAAPVPSATTAQAPELAPARAVTVTVKLTPNRYETLKVYGAKKRKTNQDILVEALDAYLSTNA